MPSLIYTIYQYFNEKKTLFYGLITLIFLLLIFFATKIQLNEDITKFIPKNEGNKKLQQVLESTKFDETIILNFRKSESASVEELTEFAKLFLDSLRIVESKFIDDIQGYVEDKNALNILNFAYLNAPLFLTDTDYKIIEHRLKQDSLNKITEANYRTLVSPTGIISKDLIIKDPLKISLLALENLSPKGQSDKLQLRNNFLVTQNEQNLLLFLRLKPNVNNEEFAKTLYKIRTNLEERNTNAKLEIFGGALIAAANAKQIKQDIYISVGIAMTVLLLIFILFYRNLFIPIILIVPTLFGGLLALIILMLIRDEISAISLGIGSVLLGVTLDYSLHILTHIKNGQTVKRICQNISRPILISSFTTAMAFLCLLFIESQALQDLGIFASVSVISASIFALLFIPQVYSVKSKETVSTTTSSSASTSSLPVRKVGSSAAIDKFAAYPFHRNKIMIMSLLALMIICTCTYSKVEFNQNISNLNFISNDLKQAEENLDAITNASSKSIYLTAYGEDFQEVMKTNDEILKTLNTLQFKNKIQSFNSLSSFINSEGVQKEKIQKWKAFWSRTSVDSLQENLINAGNPLGFKPSAFNPFYDYLKSEFSSIALEDIQQTGIINPNNFVSQSDNLNTITTMVKVEENEIENLRTIFSNSSRTMFIDRQALNESLLGNLKTDFNNLIIYCLIAVVGLLLLYYRNLKLTLVTVIPILLTWLVTIGLMGLFGLQFNIFNIIISSFIFGLGVDYSIFITNGLLTSNKSYSYAYKLNKTSIILSVITTILGVGVLIFAKHPALQSIALISIIGILTAMLICFTIQPLLFNFIVNTKRWAK